ncbi:MAG: hypothetical protein IPN71_19120 [Fibrobacteres bacterium]|jgi:hypothetical protein|nr:hypothetical protein [Fibrobacterota bacterium]
MISLVGLLLGLSAVASDTLPPPAASQSPAARAWHWVADDFEVLAATSGTVDFAGDLFGDRRFTDLPPGYRSDFKVWVDFFRWKGFISNWLIGNTTVASRFDSTAFQLSHIRYVLTPGYRYEFESWQISGLLLHECVHTVSRPEANGSVWWNSFQIGAGTKGAYHDHFVDSYRKAGAFPSLRLDGRLDFGQFLYGGRSVWIGQNHDFRQEVFGLARLRLGSVGPFGFFQDVEPHLWRASSGRIDQKWSLSTHMYLLGKNNIVGGYARWIPLDQNPHDNENGLGKIGFEIVF